VSLLQVLHRGELQQQADQITETQLNALTPRWQNTSTLYLLMILSSKWVGRFL
jgi:hypothetical protein